MIHYEARKKLFLFGWIDPAHRHYQAKEEDIGQRRLCTQPINKEFTARS